MIDVHCHYYPEPYTELITRLSARGQPRFPYPTTDADDQLAARRRASDAFIMRGDGNAPAPSDARAYCPPLV